MKQSRSQKYTKGEGEIFKTAEVTRARLSMLSMRSRAASPLVHELLIVRGIDDVVGEVDQELSKTALGGRIVS